MISVDNQRNTGKKGIYKDLYKALDTDKNKKHHETRVENFSARVPRGIYKDIYKNIEKADQRTNVWHKYPLKLLVYSNDAGEAVRPIIGNALAKLSWIPAIFYTVFALKTSDKKEDMKKEIAFQIIASFLLPFLLLKSTRAVAAKALDKIPAEFKAKIKTETGKISLLDKVIDKFKKKNSCGHRNLALSGVGIGVLAVGVKPIDDCVKNILDKHL